MTRESALVCLDIPSNNSKRSKYRQQLIDKAKEFLASLYKDLENFEDEICNMKFAAIEAVLSGDMIWTSEDEVFEIVIKWARRQFPGLQERQEALGSCITRLVRFPFMTNRKLREVLECEDLNGDFAKDVVNEALLFKAESRAYMKRTIFYDLSLEDCKKLKLEGIKLYSEEFFLGKQPFSLRMQYEPSIDSFGLFLSIQNPSLVAIEVEGEFAVKKKPEMVFVKKTIFKRPGMLYKRKYTYRGTFNLVHMPWESFISDNSPYFIDGVLHLKVDLSVVE
ncbi:BTB/POZ domain-containing protein POB1 [Acorus gramineus]|uniref:BTB/POZ domain-containing protein POB1 n=1 Tax=Acorus gramineus TaxID=55184 RepID=A0AAV9AJW2_ACOGR|nr:BTB/POZ domain-containing protein POB1 [Acorus gramineus]